MGLFPLGNAGAQPLPPAPLPPNPVPEAPLLEAAIDGNVTALDIRVPMDAPGRRPPLLWSDEMSQLGTTYFRLHVGPSGVPFPAGAELRLISGAGDVSRINLASLGADGAWSDLILGGRVRLAVLSPQPAPGAVLRIDRMQAEAKGVTLYSTWGDNEILPVHDPQVPQVVGAVASSVAFLSFIEGGRSRSCTGFLISADTLLTNEHCIRSAGACASMRAVFGYEFAPDGRLAMGPQSACAGFEPALSDFATDVTVIRLVPPPGDGYRPVALPAPAGDPPERPPEGPLFIVQHPTAQPKQVSITNCGWRDWPVAGRAADSDFTHTCDTARGSSGAPVFDLAGRLVGIHHFGFRDTDSTVWTENRAVRIGPVARWLSQQGLP
ncbi:MAG: serine protease [Pseudomonadota bacterium]